MTDIIALLIVISFLILLFVGVFKIFKFIAKKEKNQENTPIDGITILVRFVGIFLAMAFEYFKQELKKEGIYVGGLINAGAYMFFCYLVIWYRHKPKTINKEQKD